MCIHREAPCLARHAPWLLSLVMLAALEGCAPAVTALDAASDELSAHEECDDLSPAERDLAERIQERRHASGLRRIPLSWSLTLVAKQHVLDLRGESSPYRRGALPGSCLLHSWSIDGPWSACCYTPDHAAADCMYEKPRELTAYRGNGYEIARWTSNRETSAKVILDEWMKSEGHRAAVLNEGTFEGMEWLAMGVAISKGFAVVWFGEELDPAGAPEACEPERLPWITARSSKTVLPWRTRDGGGVRGPRPTGFLAPLR